jgi:hypothetical protein
VGFHLRPISPRAGQVTRTRTGVAPAAVVEEDGRVAGLGERARVRLEREALVRTEPVRPGRCSARARARRASTDMTTTGTRSPSRSQPGVLDGIRTVSFRNVGRACTLELIVADSERDRGGSGNDIANVDL